MQKLPSLGQKGKYLKILVSLHISEIEKQSKIARKKEKKKERNLHTVSKLFTDIPPRVKNLEMEFRKIKKLL